jgi:outer membrane protein OmpA-like peptidoglycan-associated protein
MKKLLLLCSYLIFILIASAQTIDKKWNIGLHAGASQYRGDLGSDFYKTNMAFYGFGGLSLSRYLGSHLDLNITATKGKIGFNRPAGHFLSDVSTATINLRLHLLKSTATVRPYIFGGWGGILFDRGLEVTPKNLDFATPSTGAGINFRLGPVVNLNLQETFLFSNRDHRDGVTDGDNNDKYLFHSVGLTFNFGKKKDADNDGVADRLDKCANTPAMVTVDKDGCPVDTDADGVANYLDKCPDIPGTAALEGCPDKDADGITDADDRCPDVAGTAAMKGCPDKDGDGVVDIDDKCPDTKAGYKVNETGCPNDNDKDGIVNEEDRCPDEAGIASLKGCADTDGDGVANIDDRCPAVKGTLANKGCPEIAPEVLQKITNIASKIFFETNSDVLKVASTHELDELVTILRNHENAILTIEGHTDSRGTDEYNMTLSQKRANAVRAYLIEKGIAENRLKAMGFGETTPIASNTTKTGMAKNRRVELKTSY